MCVVAEEHGLRLQSDNKRCEQVLKRFVIAEEQNDEKRLKTDVEIRDRKQNSKGQCSMMCLKLSQ